MTEQNILRPDLDRFFAVFSRVHRGEWVTLRVGEYEIAGDQPLQNVMRDGEDIVVEVGEGAERDHLGLRVVHPQEVKLEQTDGGADAAVEMTGSSGERTVVRFRWPIRPDLLDPAVE